MLMNCMQRRAALWIIGTFRTSPTMAIEAIAGLIPIHLHLSKLAQRSSVQMSTFHQMHVLHMFSGLHAECTQYSLSPLFLTERQTDKVSRPLIEAVKHQPAPNKILTPLPMEGVPGLRLLVIFPCQCIISLPSCSMFHLSLVCSSFPMSLSYDVTYDIMYDS
jgi:hypothetical protein